MCIIWQQSPHSMQDTCFRRFFNAMAKKIARETQGKKKRGRCTALMLRPTSESAPTSPTFHLTSEFSKTSQANFGPVDTSAVENMYHNPQNHQKVYHVCTCTEVLYTEYIVRAYKGCVQIYADCSALLDSSAFSMWILSAKCTIERKLSQNIHDRY